MYEQRFLRGFVGLSAGFVLAAGCGPEDAEEADAQARFRAAAVSDELMVDSPVRRPTPGRWPTAAFDGSQYLVVWEDHRARRPILYGARVTADGQAIDDYGFVLLDAVPGSKNLSEYQPTVVFDGANFLVVTTVANEIRGLRVSPAGEVLNPNGFLIATSSSRAARPSLSFDGQQTLVAWSQGSWTPGPSNGVYHAWVGPDTSDLDLDAVQMSTLGIAATPVAVSFDGTQHLVSWVDRDPQTRALGLYASRIATDGTVVDESPLRVSPEGVGADYNIGSAAAFDGSNHVIAWTLIGESPEGWEEIQVRAIQVSPDRTLPNPDGILIATHPAEGDSLHRLDIAGVAGSSTVVWSMDYGGEGGPAASWIRAARISSDGTTQVYPTTTFGLGLEAKLAPKPDGALLLYRHGNDRFDDYPAITGMLLDATGVPVPGGELAPASPASRQDVKAVASDGQDFFVLWTDTRDPNAEGRALYGGRVRADGTPLDDPPMKFTSTRADLADVVFDGESYVVTWVRFTGGEGDGNPFRTVRVSPSGLRLDATPLEPPLSSPNNTLASASDKTNTLLVGSDTKAYGSLIASVLIDQQGQPLGEVVHILDKGQGLGLEPRASFNGSNYMVAWHDNRTIHAQRISKEGELQGQRFSVVSRDFIYRMALTAGNMDHFVVWQDKAGIWATRVNPGAQALDPAGILVATPTPLVGIGCSGNCPAVAFDGEQFIVAWYTATNPGDLTSLDLYAATVSPDGEVSLPFAVSAQPEREGPPHLAGADGRALAAYSRFVPGSPHDSVRALARLLEAAP